MKWRNYSETLEIGIMFVIFMACILSILLTSGCSGLTEPGGGWIRGTVTVTIGGQPVGARTKVSIDSVKEHPEPSGAFTLGPLDPGSHLVRLYLYCRKPFGSASHYTPVTNERVTVWSGRTTYLDFNEDIGELCG